jgi:hypothetical protein
MMVGPIAIGTGTRRQTSDCARPTELANHSSGGIACCDCYHRLTLTSRKDCNASPFGIPHGGYSLELCTARRHTCARKDKTSALRHSVVAFKAMFSRVARRHVCDAFWR